MIIVYGIKFVAVFFIITLFFRNFFDNKELFLLLFGEKVGFDEFAEDVAYHDVALLDAGGVGGGDVEEQG